MLINRVFLSQTKELIVFKKKENLMKDLFSILFYYAQYLPKVTWVQLSLSLISKPILQLEANQNLLLKAFLNRNNQINLILHFAFEQNLGINILVHFCLVMQSLSVIVSTHQLLTINNENACQMLFKAVDLNDLLKILQFQLPDLLLLKLLFFL